MRNPAPRSVVPATKPLDDAAAPVREILIHLRTRNGLSADRLRSTEIDIGRLEQLSIVRRYFHLSQIDASDTGSAPPTIEQSVEAVIRLAAQHLPPTDRLIADAALCLRMFDGTAPAGIDLTKLYAIKLSSRRSYLELRWRQLHTALHVIDVPPPATVRTLRDSREAKALNTLAELLVSGRVSIPTARDTVTIVGDAVVDQLHRIELIPRPGTSVWGDISRHPGGKGLNRAVALARLGLDARLLAVIGNDEEGRSIQGHLMDQRVDTSLLDVRETRTPVTTGLLTPNSEPAYIASRKVVPVDLDSPVNRRAIADSKAVVLTFEQPQEVIEQLLKYVGELKNSQAAAPWLIVNISPPREVSDSLQRHLSAVDYLVGSSNDLRGLRATDSVADVIEWLIDGGNGVRAVCSIDDTRCAVRRFDGWATEAEITPPEVLGSAGAASAFSAALTQRLVTLGSEAGADDFAWAMAAVAARPPTAGVSAAMPSAGQIEKAALTQSRL